MSYLIQTFLTLCVFIAGCYLIGSESFQILCGLALATWSQNFSEHLLRERAGEKLTKLFFNNAKKEGQK